LPDFSDGKTKENLVRNLKEKTSVKMTEVFSTLTTPLRTRVNPKN
jgi:hypothetical protein